MKEALGCEILPCQESFALKFLVVTMSPPPQKKKAKKVNLVYSSIKQAAVEELSLKTSYFE